MSRSNVLKSRAEKPPASRLATATITNLTHDIVPGKFTGQDWDLLIERNDGDDFVCELIKEWYADVDRIIHDNFIQQQLVPYTVAQAKEAILQIIDWQFLTRDDGEPVNEVTSGWAPDSEPEAAPLDCWAQGAIPKNTGFSPRLAAPDVEEALDMSTTNPNSRQSESHSDRAEDNFVPTDRCGSNLVGSTDESADITESLLIKYDDSNSAMTTSVQLKRLSKEISQRKQLSTADDSRDLAKSQHLQNNLQNNSPPTNHKKQQAVKFIKPIQPEDDSLMKRIVPHKLPTNTVNAMFCIVDPGVQEAEKSRKASRKSRRPLGALKESPKLHSDMNSEQMCPHFVEIPSTFHPMLIDTMDLATGVVVRDSNNRVKKGPKQRPLPEAELLSKALSRGLHPVKGHGYSISDLLGAHVPIIRPVIIETPPIPPINQSS